MLLDDQEFQKRVIETIRTRHRPATSALREVLNEVIRTLETLDRSTFAPGPPISPTSVAGCCATRGDAVHRPACPTGSVVVAVELSPSETTSFDPEIVRAVVTDHGGPTSHAAILARSRGSRPCWD